MKKGLAFVIIGVVVFLINFSFVKYALAITPNIWLDHYQNGKTVTFTFHASLDSNAGCGWGLYGEGGKDKMVIHYGDGNSETFSCVTEQHNPDPMWKCQANISHFYNNPGIYVINTKARYSGCMDWKTVFDSVIIIATPAVCGDGHIDPGEDCDDGNTLDGDGCDSTCHLEGGGGNATSYRNPLLWQDIPEFAHRGVIFFFTLALYSSPLLILIGAYVLLTSGGSSEKIAKGKKIIIWTLVGLAIMLLGKAIIAFIKMLLGG